MTTEEPFTCPRCGRTSHSPDDAFEGYCGHCHDWTRIEDDPWKALREADEDITGLPTTEDEIR